MLPSLAAERAAIRERSSPDDLSEVLTQRRGGSKADLARDMLDRELCGLQQALGATDPGVRDPARRRGPDLVTEPPAEGSGTHRGAARDGGEGQIFAQVLLQPGEHGRERAAVA